MNSSYSIAEGSGSEDIVPTLVFDDGRFTYFRFPGNREVPAVFHVLGDGSETLVNAPHGRRPAGGRPGQPPVDAARRLGRGRRLERGIRPGRRAARATAPPCRACSGCSRPSGGGSPPEAKGSNAMNDPRMNPDRRASRADDDGNTIAPLPGEAGIPTSQNGRAARCRTRACWRWPADRVADRGVGGLHPALCGERQESRRRQVQARGRPAAAASGSRAGWTCDAARQPRAPRQDGTAHSGDRADCRRIAEPIGVRRTGQAPQPGARDDPPEDAPSCWCPPGRGPRRGRAHASRAERRHPDAAQTTDGSERPLAATAQPAGLPAAVARPAR